ncbi:hypothetical protein QR680_003863 [Steinernema hermaphroditum]|uniref:Uncharacterized protein n=1 Tax=Steinernema hermaphroditum TaxID=289476 RepID=A0AA39HN84_9BILA|nr:hypothetical protein QR680_003863 [Steinernema hermaphroditum]
MLEMAASLPDLEQQMKIAFVIIAITNIILIIMMLLICHMITRSRSLIGDEYDFKDHSYRRFLDHFDSHLMTPDQGMIFWRSFKKIVMDLTSDAEIKMAAAALLASFFTIVAAVFLLVSYAVKSMRSYCGSQQHLTKHQARQAGYHRLRDHTVVYITPNPVGYTYDVANPYVY